MQANSRSISYNSRLPYPRIGWQCPLPTLCQKLTLSCCPASSSLRPISERMEAVGRSEQPSPEELFPKDALLLRLVFLLSNSPCVLGSLEIHQFLTASWHAMVLVLTNRPGAAGKKATDESESGG